MLPTLALVLASRAAPLTGEQVLALVKRTLADFDVRGPFRVQSLGRYGAAPHPDSWSATVSAPDGARYTAYLDVQGRLRSLERVKRPAYRRGPLPPAHAARMDRWLSKVRPRFAVQPWKEQDSENGRIYQATVAGYPFVDPNYAYSFTLENGAFAGFMVTNAPPPTGPTVPRVTRAAAEGAAEPVFRSMYRPGRVEYRLDRRPTRLAWLETPASPPAILVWRVTGVPHILGGDWTRSPQAVELFYDAVSGRRVERRPR